MFGLNPVKYLKLISIAEILVHKPIRFTLNLRKQLHPHPQAYFQIKYRAIKLICNRVIHESEIVCRFLNKKHSLKHRLDLGISIEKTYGFKSMDHG
jgi:hypothetical protein